jgi:hypothetical protein
VRVTTGSRRGLRGRVLTAVALTGVAPAGATRAAGRGPAALEPGTPSAPGLELNGTWTEFGIECPTVTVVNDRVLVDMSFARRPDATGTVLDATTILVTFPDAGTFLGVLRTPTFLCWSNGSSWQKVFTGPQIFDLQGAWVDRNNQLVAHVRQGHGHVGLELRGSGPRGVAFATGASTIRATFPGDVRRLGTLEAPNLVRWSDGGLWRRTGPAPIRPRAGE